MTSPTEDSSISVAIVSKGRPDILGDTLRSISRQTVKPGQIVVVVPGEEDLPRGDWSASVQFIVGPLGTCVQRNRAIEAIPLTVNYVAFLDDDVELAPDYLAQAVLFLQRCPGVSAFSGRELRLAKNNINREQAQKLIDDYHPREDYRGRFFDRGKWHSLHGCNMVIRRGILAYEKFDESLPLYAFGEDYDMSMRLERYGRVGKFHGCVLVHLASPGGRISEVRRGYAQVANPWYFLKKGTVHYPPFMALVHFWAVCVGRNCWNALRGILRRDHTLDWAGRLKGHLLAVKDIVLGRSSPDRIKEIG
jgi:GT2 family glycosyltransferase